MKRKKLAMTVLSLFTAMSLAVGPVAAQINDTNVLNSGDHVDVSTSANSSTDVDITTYNQFECYQNVNSINTSGGNELSGNISLGGGDQTITTGNAGSSIKLECEGNKTKNAVLAGSSGSSNLTDVINTGEKVDVETQTNSTKDVDIETSSYAKLYQDVYTVNTSGENALEDNVGKGKQEIQTGHSGSSVWLMGSANETANLVAEGGLGHGASPMSSYGGASYGGLSNATQVTNTGEEVDIDTNASSNTAVDIATFNAAWIGHAVESESTSGHNDNEGNIGSEQVIKTGHSGADIHLDADVNDTKNAVFLGGYKKDGLNFLNFVNTGDTVETDATAEKDVNVDVATENKLSIEEYVLDVSTSGLNFGEHNIGGHQGIHTGHSGLSLKEHGEGNTTMNLVGESFFDVFLGVLGL